MRIKNDLRLYWGGCLLAANLISTAVFAQDEDPLPPAVANAFVAYEQALETRDYQAAREAARSAWQSARQEELADDLVAILAANYGELALAFGEHEVAYSAWREAATLEGRTGGHPAARGHAWYNASVAAYAGGDLRDAHACADNAIRAVRRNAADVPADLRGQIYFMAAKTNAELGRLRRVGDEAAEALEAFAEAGRAHDGILADTYYLMAVDRFFWGDREASVQPFRMAEGIYALLGERRAREARVSRLWGRLARRDLDEEETQRVDEAIAASDYPLEERVVSEPGRELEDGYVDARPRTRREPIYPQDAVNNGLEGLVLVQFDVTPDGHTDDIEVLAAVPVGVFDAESLAAVRGWRYEPARIHG